MPEEEPEHLRFGAIETGDYHDDGGDPTAHCYAEYERADNEAWEIHKKRRYMIRKPRVLQYFRGKVLVRSPSERGSGRLELFFDLVFVGLIAVMAESCVEHSTGTALVRYLLTYFPAFMIWTYMRELFNNYFHDDFLQRCLVLVVMMFLVVYGNNATEVEFSIHDEEDKYARATTISCYLLACFCIVGVYFMYSFHIVQLRTQTRAHCLFWIPVFGLWIGAIFASVRVAIALVVIAIVYENSLWAFIFSPAFKRMANLYYSSATSIDHEVERFGDFVTLVHGEFLFSVISGEPAGTGVHEGTARTVLTVITAFSLYGLYTECAGSKQITHPIRHSATRAISWMFAHMPLVSALTLCGDCTALMIPTSHVEHDGLRWMFCGSFAVGMLSLFFLAMLEKDNDAPGVLFMPKWVRIGPRVAAAIIMALVPLASQHKLNTTGLLGLSCGLSAFCLIWQFIGSLDGPSCDWYVKDSDEQSGAERQEHTVEFSRKWSGFPVLFEPGFFKADRRHQRVSDINKNQSSSDSSAQDDPSAPQGELEDPPGAIEETPEQQERNEESYV